MLDDTIAAIATPLGEGGLAVIRISGRQALAVADKCFRTAATGSPAPSSLPTHTVHFGRVVKGGATIDEAMLTIMRAPRSFTREDVVELACHGGVLAAKMVLETVLSSGARIAEPGEFTRRAFLNGRIDLAQAEAVADLIHSRTELALRAATEQLSGKLSRRINELRDQLMDVLAHVEAHIDFPEEDIDPDRREQILERLLRGVEFIDDLLRTANEGRVLRRGIRAVIVGRPNTGKSSLLNCLLGHERAIVSTVPGTTRDTIEETANIRGIPIVFIDTAGLREAQDEIEREGVLRSRRSSEVAELILQVVDGSEPPTAEDRLLLAEFGGRPRIVVVNKIDLPGRITLPEDAIPVVKVSCLTEEGIEQLKDTIKEKVWSGEISNQMLEVMINSRHQDALARARVAILRAVDSLREQRPLELAAADLRLGANAVGEVVGKTATEDLLDAIFSRFCIGK